MFIPDDTALSTLGVWAAVSANVLVGEELPLCRAAGGCWEGWDRPRDSRKEPVCCRAEKTEGEGAEEAVACTLADQLLEQDEEGRMPRLLLLNQPL